MSGFNNQSLEEITDKLTRASENMSAVYAKGRSQGHREGFADGRLNERASFWSNYMNNGRRRHYECAFAGKYWNRDNFKPPYSIRPSNELDDATSIFESFNEGNEPIDMAALVEELGIELDFSQTMYLQNAFFGDGVSKWGHIDVSGAGSVAGIFGGNGANTLECIEHIVSGVNTSWQNNSFANQGGLTHVIFSGIIAKGFNIKWSPLDRESIESIISCLSSDTSGKTVQLSLAAVNSAFETSQGANDGISSSEWSALTASRSNWNFVYE